MKRHVTLALVVLTGLVCATAWASEKNKQEPRNYKVPMIVQVNKNGKVTDVKPAYHMRPSFVRSLRAAVEKMITKPAMHNGKPVSSQFIMNVAVSMHPDENGNATADYKYVSSKPLPSGTWHWIRTKNNRLALANQQRSRIAPMRNMASQVPPNMSISRNQGGNSGSQNGNSN